MIRRTLALLSLGAALAACGTEPVAPVAPSGLLPSTTVSALSVYIEGPSEVPSNTECGWTAYVDGGTPPYRLYWNYAGVYGYTFGNMFRGTLPKWGSSTQHQLHVVVKDANNMEATGYHDVTVFDWAPLCEPWP